MKKKHPWRVFAALSSEERRAYEEGRRADAARFHSEQKSGHRAQTMFGRGRGVPRA